MKKLIAIALIGCFSPAVMPQSSRAQVVESVVGASACAASVGCGVVVGIVFLGGIGYYVLNAGGRKYRIPPSQMEIHAQPMPQAGPRPDMRSGGSRNDDSGRQAETGRLSRNRGGCVDMVKRAQQGGFRVSLIRTERNNAPGTFLEIWCVIAGDSREIARFNKYWR